MTDHVRDHPESTIPKPERFKPAKLFKIGQSYRISKDYSPSIPTSEPSLSNNNVQKDIVAEFEDFTNKDNQAISSASTRMSPFVKR
ncbi:hypothetical protein HDV05_001378, partial [Chytridiales sp. JEL 0842]